MSFCKLFLEDVYYTGKTGRGMLLCSFKGNNNVRGIHLEITGQEHTEWEDRETYYDTKGGRYRTHYVTFSGETDFFHHKQQLQPKRDMTSGYYEYKFTFNLPANMPSGFEGTHGWIRYKAKAIVDLPLKFDYEDEKLLQVVSFVDFNHLPSNLQEPREQSNEKYVCCCCCAHGPITMDVYLSKIGYVLGDNIHIKLEVSNLSNVSVETIDVNLSQTITYKTNYPNQDSKDEKNLLCSLVENGVGAHGENVYHLSLEVPSRINIPNLDRATLFDTTYTLTISSVLPSCHNDLEIDFNLTLGHIPHHRGRDIQSQAEVKIEAHATPPPYDLDNINIDFPDEASAPPDDDDSDDERPPLHPGFFPRLPPSAYPPPMAGTYAPLPENMVLPMRLPGMSTYCPTNGYAVPPSWLSAQLFGDPNAIERMMSGSNDPTAPPPSYDEIEKNDLGEATAENVAKLSEDPEGSIEPEAPKNAMGSEEPKAPNDSN